MSVEPPVRPDQEMVDFLQAQWDPAQTRGFDPTAGSGTDAFLPLQTDIDQVGAVYPSLVITLSSETSAGESTFDYLTDDGPGQRVDGTLIATARASVEDDGYVGDSGAYSAADADVIVDEIAEQALDICRDHWDAPNTAFDSVGGQRGPAAEDDRNVTPTVRLAQRQLDYSARWRP